MNPLYIALGVYYAIPAVAFGILHWWETDLIMGSRSAYWQERFDLRHIVVSIIASALWPLVGVRLVWSFYLRWPRGRELCEVLAAKDAEIRKLKFGSMDLDA